MWCNAMVPLLSLNNTMVESNLNHDPEDNIMVFPWYHPHHIIHRRRKERDIYRRKETKKQTNWPSLMNTAEDQNTAGQQLADTLWGGSHFLTECQELPSLSLSSTRDGMVSEPSGWRATFSLSNILYATDSGRPNNVIFSKVKEVYKVPCYPLQLTKYNRGFHS